jgi:hypothetical protein
MKRKFKNTDERILNGQDEKFLANLLRQLNALGVQFGSEDEFSKIETPEISFPEE